MNIDEPSPAENRIAPLARGYPDTSRVMESILGPFAWLALGQMSAVFELRKGERPTGDELMRRVVFRRISTDSRAPVD